MSPIYKIVYGGHVSCDKTKTHLVFYLLYLQIIDLYLFSFFNIAKGQTSECRIWPS